MAQAEGQKFILKTLLFYFQMLHSPEEPAPYFIYWRTLLVVPETSLVGGGVLIPNWDRRFF